MVQVDGTEPVDPLVEPDLTWGQISDLEALLRAQGFTRITALVRKGGSILCEATGPHRERVHLVIDARSGEIAGLRVIGFADQRY